MKVTVVGTGCTWYTRKNTSFILDDTMLFDVSSGNYKEIIKSVDIFDLNAIFISHLHSDHVGDLHIVTTRFIREAKKRSRTTKLKVYGVKGIAEFIINYKKVTHSLPDELEIESLLNIVEFIEVKDGFEFEESGYKVKVYRMQHGFEECYGYSFTDKNGKTYSFSADTSECENLRVMLKNSDFAFVDMAAVSENKNHLHYERFIELEKEFANCKMFPVHTSDPSQEFAIQNNMNYLIDGQILEI